MNRRRRMGAACLGLAVGLLLSFGAKAAETETVAPVVMVCEHGTVKSVIAMELFNQEAMRRGLPFRAVSRGMAPDEAVPPKIAAALAEDGLDVSEFEPKKIASGDFVGALRVVSIGSDLSAFNDDSMSTILQWDDIPPASVDYKASKAAIQKRVEALLDELN